MFAQGFSDGFGFRMDLQFFVNVFQVKRNRVNRNIHVAGGGFFVMSFDEEFKE